MNVPFRIARRYLWARKSQRLIHLVSGISVVVVAAVCAAMIAILSAFNGIEELVEELFSSLDTELAVLPAEGRVMEATWIDTPAQLEQLKQRLTSDNSCKVIAVDLEHHSYRSFAGILCLMQISIRKNGDDSDNDDNDDDDIENFLVDTIVLKPFLQDALLDAFTNPAIVKVLHGADSDIVWLQQLFFYSAVLLRHFLLVVILEVPFSHGPTFFDDAITYLKNTEVTKYLNVCLLYYKIYLHY